MTKERFIVIALPADHKEELGDLADDISSILDYASAGSAVVIYPVNQNVANAIEAHHTEELP